MDLQLMVREMIKSGMTDAEILQSLRELGVENVERVLQQAVAADVKEAAKNKPLKMAADKAPEEKGNAANENSTRGSARKEEGEDIGFGLTGKSAAGNVLSEKGEEEEEAEEELGKPLFGKGGNLQEREEKEEVLEGKDLFGKKPAKREDRPPVLGNQRAESSMAEVESLFGNEKEARASDEKATEEEAGEENGEEEGLEPPKRNNSKGAGGDEDALGLPKLEITSVSPQGESPKNLEEMLGRQLMQRPAGTTLSNAEEVERKLDEAIALLRALQEINKKILDANRELLLKMKTQK